MENIRCMGREITQMQKMKETTEEKVKNGRVKCKK